MSTGNREGGKTLIKKSGAIHISGSLTLMQRKCWNIMLAHCYDNLTSKKTHTIPISVLKKNLGDENMSSSFLYKSLDTLVSTGVKWNTLEKDKDNSWRVVTTLVASISTKGGVCKYEYSDALQELLSAPAMYTKLLLRAQNDFSSYYGLALYEICMDYFNVGKTPWIDLKNFRTLMGVEIKTYSQFKEFNRRVIQVGIKEVNKYSDLNIKVEFQREKRKVARLKFSIQAKEGTQPKQIRHPQEAVEYIPQREEVRPKVVVQSQEESSLYKDIIALGVNISTAQNLLKKYPPNYLARKLNLAREKNNKGKVNNLAAFFIASVARDYIELPNSTAKKEEEPKGAYIVSPLDYSTRNEFEKEWIRATRQGYKPGYAERELEEAEQRWGKDSS